MALSRRYLVLVILAILTLNLSFTPPALPVSAQIAESIKVPPNLEPNFGADCDGNFWYDWSDGAATGYITMNTDVPEDSTNSAAWAPAIPGAGTYLVEAYFPVLNFGSVPADCFNALNPQSFSSRAKFTITSSGGVTDTVIVDENQTGQWISLGAYTFDQGSTGKVELTDVTDEPAFSRFVAFSDLRFTNTSVPNTHIYLPMIVDLYPKVLVDASWTEDIYHTSRVPFLHGETILFNARGTNKLSFTALADVSMKIIGPCGENIITTEQVPLNPGSWTLERQAVAPQCPGIHFLQVRVTFRGLVSSSSYLFIVKQESVVLPTTQQFFDKCEVASIDNMNKWWAGSPYFHTNLYIGGISRYCDNDQLSALWVEQAETQGWGFVPTWVGPQAPCTSFNHRFSYNADIAYTQGVDEANMAASTARSLGFLGNNVIYYDLEAFPGASQSCRNTVKSFLNGWTYQLHQQGYISGVYGSGCSSYANDWITITNRPDEVWLANWVHSSYTPTASPYGVSCVADSLWEHHRLRQYAGGHNESWGNASLGYVTFNIDSNAADGNVVNGTGSLSAQIGEPVVDAQLLSEGQGWAILGSRLLWTDDAGGSWSDITPPEAASASLLAASFTDPDTGWLVVESDRLQVLRTVDGGNSWTAAALPQLDSGGVVKSFGFSDAENGWLEIQLPSSSSFSLGVLYRSNDGGATWTEMTLPAAGELTFTDTDNGWLAGGPGGDQLYRTTDAGSTWEQVWLIQAEPGSSKVSLPAFSDPLHGMIAATINQSGSPRVELFSTTDGGSNWVPAGTIPLDTQQDAPAWLAPIGASQWITALSENGELFASSGRNVTAVSSGRLPQGIVELTFSGSIGWAVAYQGQCNGVKGTPEFACAAQSLLYLTRDGGSTWTQITLPDLQ